MNGEEFAMKKNDLLLLATVLIVAGVCFGMRLLQGGDGAVVTVRVDGEITERLELDKDQVLDVNGGTNKIEIKDGKVHMREADCPDQLCVHQKSIQYNNESIICLPNKVVVQIESSEESDYDSIAN